jgi:Ig-like domain from next to BRCA1 gene
MKFNNTGTLAWVDGFTTNFYLVSQNPALNQIWGGNGVPLSAFPTQPGQQLNLDFTAIAPSTPGTYNFQWQMYQNGGIGFFGQMSPNVVIQVGNTPPPPAPVNDAAFISQTVPTTMTAGQSTSVSIAMTNSGTTTWAAGTYKLGSQNPQDNTTWGLNRVNLVSSVAPGGNATFTFNVAAPTTPGTYNFQWRMNDGSAFFGTASTNASVTVTGGSTPTNDAAFVSQTVPSSMTAGQSYTVSVVMRNSGTTTWAATYKLGSQNPQDNTTWGLNRVNLVSPAPPTSQVTFSFNVTAPTTPGTYNFQWKMFDGTTFFGAASTNISVTVAAGGGCTVATAPAPTSLPNDTIWVDDQLPSGAVAEGVWIWDTSQKASGTQSNTEPAQPGIHQHYFYNASPLVIGANDKLVAYVLLSNCDTPQEIMLQWNDASGWEHRAYWGANVIPWGSNGTASRMFMGALPATGQWVRLEVPASMVAMNGHVATGMAFSLSNGQAWFDRAGKSSQ